MGFSKERNFTAFTIDTDSNWADFESNLSRTTKEPKWYYMVASEVHMTEL